MHIMVDGNGSQRECAIDNVYPQYISSYRVCERYVSCTAWKGTDGPLGG